MQTAAKTTALTLTALATVASAAAAQEPYLFSLSNPAPTLSGSGGTALERLRRNEIHQFFASPNMCGTNSSEKWAPRTAFETMAGDDDGNDVYVEPALMGAIDAVLSTQFFSGSGAANLRRGVYYSPAIDLQPCVSGGAGLRRGDVGRIVRNGSGDGQVQYFIRAEQIQSALGLPATPAFVNVDAVAAGPNYGVFFSLEEDHLGLNADCGVTASRDGDVWLIPPWAISWTPNLTVGGVLPNSAMRVYTELQMNAMVASAGVSNHMGACLSAIGDTDALEIDWLMPTVGMPLTSCSGFVATIPHLLFAGEDLTGASLLDTVAGGRIRPSACGPLGSPCGTGPTFGNQFGIRPFSSTQGWNTSINGISIARANRFVIESPAPSQAAPASIDIHIGSPGVFTWVFATLAPAGACNVSPSLPFGPTNCFPDLYVSGGAFIGVVPTAGGFASVTTPVLGIPAEIVFQGVTVLGANIQLSTPATVELF